MTTDYSDQPEKLSMELSDFNETSSISPINVRQVCKKFANYANSERINKVVKFISDIVSDPEKLIQHCSFLINSSDGIEGVRVSIKIEIDYLSLADSYYLCNVFKQHGWENVGFIADEASQYFENFWFRARLPMLYQLTSI